MNNTCIIREMGGVGDILMMSPIIKELALNCNNKIDIAVDISLLSEIKILKKTPFVGKVFDVKDLNRNNYKNVFDLSYVAYAYEQAGFTFSRQEIFAIYCKVRPNCFLPTYKPKVLYSFKKKTIAIHTEAAEKRRSWENAKTQQLIKWILKETDWNILYLNQKPLGFTNGRIRDCSNEEIDKCVEFLSGTNLLVAVDSCFIHFSAALKIKTIVLFGSTKPETRIKHYLSHKSIYTKNKCKGCFYKHCESYNCMFEITVDEVVEKISDEILF